MHHTVWYALFILILICLGGIVTILFDWHEDWDLERLTTSTEIGDSEDMIPNQVFGWQSPLLLPTTPSALPES